MNTRMMFGLRFNINAAKVDFFKIDFNKGIFSNKKSRI